MRATIIRADNSVIIDGMQFQIGAVAMLPADVHAVQWYGSRGEIEYKFLHCEHCGTGSKKPNEAISDFSPYQPLVDAWTAAKAAYDAEQEQLRKEAEARALEAAQAAQAAGEHAAG